MASLRAEPFHLALVTLRDRLREGAFPPGERLPATIIADDLRLSATPVREALARLAGEGLLDERRGQGFFVRTLSGCDLADLHRLSLAQLSIVLDARRGAWRRPLEPSDVDGPAAAGGAPGDPAARVERLFAGWVAERGSRALIQAHRSLQAQLGALRRLEGLVFADLAEEALALELLTDPADGAARLRQVRRYHARRIQLADRLAALAQRPRPDEF